MHLIPVTLFVPQRYYILQNQMMTFNEILFDENVQRGKSDTPISQKMTDSTNRDKIRHTSSTVDMNNIVLHSSCSIDLTTRWAAASWHESLFR
jgi:hypothetical protein